MKRILLIMIMFLASCVTPMVEPMTEVRFSADKFKVESGQLKSFDINTWKHFHYPYTITVSLENINTGVIYHSTAANANVFFNEGTEMIHIPVGNYLVSVQGGGYPNDTLTHSYSYYVWNIKDTTIIIGNNSHGDPAIINFNLNKTSALVVKDAVADIKLIAYRNSSLSWTGRGVYDFAYVTPGTYSGQYTDSLGYQTNTEWFDIKADNYYYFVTPVTTKSIVTIPDFVGNEIKF